MKAQEAFEKYHAAVFRFAYRFTGSADSAGDITQECFLALLCAPERFDGARGSMKTYLLGIARRLALKHYRDGAPEEPLETEPPAPATDELLGAELSEVVRQAVAGLPELQREALVLFEYEELSLEEVARVVGADIGTVKSRLHRARERLKRQLAPYRNSGVQASWKTTN